MSPTSNTPEGTRAQPENAQQQWAPAPWPGSNQPIPPQPVYPPPPEMYQDGGWSQQPAQAGVYPPPPAWYQPGQTQYPQWSAPATDWPGYAPPPDTQRPQHPQSRAAAETGATGWFSRFAIPILSVPLSFVVYAAFWGWEFSLGAIVLLFVHEMGHFVVIRAKGLPANLPVFIPLLGAYVAMRRMPQSVRDEAEIGIAGPVAGTAAGLVCFWLYAQFHVDVMLPLAYFSFFLNLLNLIPVSPLDGARVTSAISKWIWPLGLVGMVVGVIYTQSLLLIALLIFGFFQMIGRFQVSEHAPYYRISTGARVYITAIYFGLIGVLVYLTYASFALHPFIGGAGSPF